MNNHVKNILGVAGILGILAFAGALGAAGYSYAKSVRPSSFRTFEVSAEGKVTSVPDIAQFTFSVITEGENDLEKLQKENTEKTNRAIAFVKEQGVEAKDIKTQGYDVQPRYQYVNCFRGPCPPPEIVGYTVTQSVLVKVRALDKAGALLGGVVTAGANNVSGLTFTIDDPQKVENEARSEAIAKAREKAEVMAQAGKFKLGKLISIGEGFGGGPVPLYEVRALEAGIGGADMAPAPTVEPGSQEVTVNVVLKYEIK